MHDGYSSRSRDDRGPGASSSYRRHSPSRQEDWDREHTRSRNDRARSPPSHNRKDQLSYDDEEDQSRGHAESSTMSDGRGHSSRYGDELGQNQGSRNMDRNLDRNPQGHPRGGAEGRSRQYESLDDPDGRPAHGRWGADTTRPSTTVLLDGLPDDVAERDIYDGLDFISGDPDMTREQVRDVRIFELRKGGCEALVSFFRLADAEAFVQRYAPDLSLPLLYSRGRDSAPVTVGVEYEKTHDEKPPHESRYEEDDWECSRCGRLNYPDREICHKCKGDRAYFDASSGPVLTGETDEDPQQSPSQYLVVRDLENSVTEEVLAKGIGKLFLDPPQPKESVSSTPNKLKSTAPRTSTVGLGARPGTLRRVFLMRDKKTKETWRYGFAEFSTVEDAKAAVAKFRALPKFTIASKPVVVGFIHTGVFVPYFDAPEGDHPNYSFAPVYNAGVRLQYWDSRAYPSPLVVSTEPMSYDDPQDDAGNNDKSSSTHTPTSKNALAKKWKKDGKEAPNKAIAMAPQMQMWAKKAAELHAGSRRPGEIAVPQSDGPAEGPENGALVQGNPSDEPRNAHTSDQYLSFADWDNLSCLVCDWSTPARGVLVGHNATHYTPGQLLIYHEVHAHGSYHDEEVRSKASEKLRRLGKEPRSITLRRARLRSELAPTYTSYADQDMLYCHLCGRSFKKISVLRLHEMGSELHGSMLGNPANIERATAELKEKDKAPLTMRPRLAGQPQYRDRAKERRHVFNQPKKPSSKPSGPSQGRKEKEAEPEPEPAPAKASKGAGLLAKMGWTSGTGLGAEGAGRTEAIATDAYAPGVGLGAEGGKLGDASEEAARNTKGNFADFVEKTKDRARERYEKLG